ncbi:alpha/beta hydrolase fold protein [Catenulispora acidiphila DSM 44928]|uniref:Alpha/beta hydrolase fold protein n=1 Tax=Catenulispora acidiphila (strain DSM 44928 / JCM 14897 / NBRC 102108 / NRRL B-24433 / ID139908) TaxID=479433 RepID=C7QAT2_CATAD|nr:alpha/beta hydrolase [Catenulispora acidiphila]ACU74405.1 alpha/beta hydrolase fold protein [Catenulispora acidiphila DSM 44928]
MPQAAANGIKLEYDTFGDPGAPPLVLIMGLGTQMTAWPAPFCQAIADEGFRVIRFDNRDCGLSTILEVPAPSFGDLLAGDTSGVPYLMSDLADDVAGLLDALGLDSAHIVGLSMGGMIAQQFAIDHPQRVRTLCSIMSTTGAADVGQPSGEVLTLLLSPAATNRDEAVDNGQRMYATIGSPAYPMPPAELRALIGQAYDRSFTPAGTARQIACIVASPDRTAALAAVSVPSAVIHGDSDKLVDVSGGRATAAALGVEPLILPGAGHDLPEQLWPTYVEAIVANARKGA